MKDINIQKKASRQITKEVCLGNGKRITFNSKRAAGYFVADTNRFLTKCLVIINETYCSCYLQYRAMWLIATNFNAGNKTQYMNVQRNIKSSLDAANDMMDKFNYGTSGSNDPFFSFIDLRKAALFIGDAARELQLFNEARNLTANKYHCQVLHERCLLIVTNLQEYDYVK
jgi:hypothetical protein